MNNVDLNDMKLFVSVVQAGSLTKAADLLNIPKSRLSRRLTGLENALGTTLLDRGKRGVTLNELGSHFFQQAQAMLHIADHAVQNVKQSLATPSGLLRISISNEIMREVLAPHLADYLRENPDVNVEITISNSKINMIQDGVDLAFRVGSIDNENVVARPLLNIELGIFATAAYLAGHGTPATPNELYRHSLLCKYDGPKWQFKQGEQSVLIEGQYRLSCNDFNLVAHQISEQMGIGLLPQLGRIIRPDFVRLLPDWQLEPATLYLLYYKNRGNTPVVRSMTEFLQKRFGA